MRLTSHGAAGEVTGSCHLVEVDGYRLLLDCGMIQGSDEQERRNRAPFPFEPSEIDMVVLSHAHIDHSGRLPLLVKRGYRGSIWTTAATAGLLDIMLHDAAALAEADADYENRHHRRDDGWHRDHDDGGEQGGRKQHRPLARPLFDRRDVAETLRRLRPLEYGREHTLPGGFRVRLRDAGHILGSAIVELWSGVGEDERKLVYTGDLGLPGKPILRDPEFVDTADLVLLESTYGDRAHRPVESTIAELGEIFRVAARDGGNVLIPAFAVGRTQELLYWFARHWDDWGLASWRIFLDSPMAIRVLDVYNRHTDLFDEQASEAWRGHGRMHPFRLPNLSLTAEVAQSQRINGLRGGAIVIAGSGMCNGGRIRHHLRQNLGRAGSHVVFVGYQATGTLGRRLVDGAERVRIFGEEIHVNARVHTVGGLSAHADQPMLLNWYGHFAARPPVRLVHGEARARDLLAAALRERFDCRVESAEAGATVEIGRWPSGTAIVP